MVAISPLTRGQFKRAICADVSAIGGIKECLNFRGVVDAVHGDRMYEKVRVQAKETLDAIYSDVGGVVGGCRGLGVGVMVVGVLLLFLSSCNHCKKKMCVRTCHSNEM